MDDFDTIVNRAATQAISQSGNIIAADSKAVIMGGEQFDSPEPEVGAPLRPVVPLQPKTLGYKRKFRFPELARYRTGALCNSILAMIQPLSGVVMAASPYASEQQFGEASNGIQPAAARPFFGVSDRAMKQINETVTWLDKQLETDLNASSADIGTVTITV